MMVESTYTRPLEQLVHRHRKQDAGCQALREADVD